MGMWIWGCDRRDVGIWWQMVAIHHKRPDNGARHICGESLGFLGERKLKTSLSE